MGLIVNLKDRYVITSNRKSGLGRYDVIFEPINVSDNAIIFVFKVQKPSEEKTLEETAAARLEKLMLEFPRLLANHPRPSIQWPD